VKQFALRDPGVHATNKGFLQQISNYDGAVPSVSSMSQVTSDTATKLIVALLPKTTSTSAHSSSETPYLQSSVSSTIHTATATVHSNTFDVVPTEAKDALLIAAPIQGITGSSSSKSNSGFHLGKGVIIGIAAGGAVLLILLGLLLICCGRRRAKRSKAASSKPATIYPEVSYLYDPPPGAPSPGAPMMAAQRGMPDSSYTGAAGVASHGEPHSERDGLLPSARSVLAPLSGYKRAGQDDSHDMGDREHLNPFRDQAGGEYRDSIDAPHR
jgi:hypothetical protein